MEQKPNPSKSGTSYVGLGLSLGAGVGAALGTAFNQLAMGVALGTSLGLLIGSLIDYSSRSKGDTGSSPEGEPGVQGSTRQKPGRSVKRRPASQVFGLFIGSMLAYAVFMVVSVLLLKVVTQPAARLLVALLPALPASFAILAVYQAIQFMDELQRTIQLELLAISLAGTVLVALTLGLLEGAGLPPFNWSWMVPVMSVFWLIGQLIAARRYQ